jgi:hypothetical protein
MEFKKMSATTVRVETTRKQLNGENETLLLTFTNYNKARDFAREAIWRSDVVNVTIPNGSVKTYSNAQKALDAISYFTGSGITKNS